MRPGTGVGLWIMWSNAPKLSRRRGNRQPASGSYGVKTLEESSQEADALIFLVGSSDCPTSTVCERSPLGSDLGGAKNPDSGLHSLRRRPVSAKAIQGPAELCCSGDPSSHTFPAGLFCSRGLALQTGLHPRASPLARLRATVSPPGTVPILAIIGHFGEECGSKAHTKDRTMNTKGTISAAVTGFGAVALLAWGGLSSGSEQAALLGGPIPAGIIVGWSGAVGSIPAGWQLCDGTRGTPDLRGRFILGAGTGKDVGETSGQASYTTSRNQRPTTEITRRGGSAALEPASGSPALNSVSMHTHTVSVMPPYYSLAFIMKLADE